MLDDATLRNDDAGKPAKTKKKKKAPDAKISSVCKTQHNADKGSVSENDFTNDDILEDNKENPIMDPIKKDDVVVYEEKEFLVVEIKDDEVTLRETDGEEEITVSLEEMTKAASTINIKNPHGSLSQMTASVLKMMSTFGSGDDGVDFFNKVQALYDGSKSHGVADGAASKNEKSTKMSPSSAASGPTTAAMAGKVSAMSKEDLDRILGDEEGLSEEFKVKAATLFEAAINLRAAAVEAELVEKYEGEFAAQKEEQDAQFTELTESLEEQIDQYLSYAAKEWLEENTVAVESSLRNSLTESFIAGLQELCQEHKMDLPEADVSVVEALADKVEELESQLNESVRQNMELVEAVEQHTASEVFDVVCEGMAMTEIEKFRTLIEGIEYTGDDQEYQSKLEIVKEKYFSKDAVPESALNEEVELVEAKEEKKIADPRMARYASSISNSVKR